MDASFALAIGLVGLLSAMTTLLTAIVVLVAALAVREELTRQRN